MSPEGLDSGNQSQGQPDPTTQRREESALKDLVILRHTLLKAAARTMLERGDASKPNP